MIAAALALLAAGYAAGRLLPFDFLPTGEEQTAGAELDDAAPRTLRDCPDCPEMVRIPGQSFAAGRYEVTRGQWAAFVRDTGRPDPLVTRMNCSWRSPGFTQDDNHPVTCVSWHDTQAYVQWLSQRTGQHYRLLTSAEWQIAARAGTTTTYSWGDQDPVCDQSALTPNGANFSVCVDDSTRPVGLFQPNGHGLYDMHGNVWEWVEDCRAEGVLESIFDHSPSCGDDYYRDRRGGSWQDDPEYLRSTYRSGIFIHPDVRWFNTGFRVARTL